MRMTFALIRSGFRRYATYRQATAASCVTNSVFGFLRAYVLLAVAGGATAAGYTAAQLSTYVWVGQGLIGVVLLWGWTELADRVRTGEVVADLLRPVAPIWSYMATDLGRAGFACTTRMIVPMTVGALAMPFYWPHNPLSYPIFVLSVFLATVVCFGLRYLINLSAFWLLDIRGVLVVWTLLSGVASGMYFPIDFLPDWLAAVLKYATPFPSIVQFPADVLVEKEALNGQLTLVGLQLMWALIAIAVAYLVQGRANRKLVIQGG